MYSSVIFSTDNLKIGQTVVLRIAVLMVNYSEGWQNYIKMFTQDLSGFYSTVVVVHRQQPTFRVLGDQTETTSQ